MLCRAPGELRDDPMCITTRESTAACQTDRELLRALALVIKPTEAKEPNNFH